MGKRRLDLRRRAEALLDQRRSPQSHATSDGDVRRLLHELEVHQVELELQNEELRASRLETERLLQRYTELFDFAPVGYFAVGVDGTIQAANFAGARLLGLERGRLLGRRFGAFVTPTATARFNAFLAEVLAAEAEDRRGCACELALQQEPSGTVHARVSAAALDGPASTALLAVEDDTARQRAEEALREESRQKDEFLATLSHELRNPLAPIRNGLFLLERAGGGEQGHRALAIIDRQVTHLTHIVDDLLDVTRIARGKVRLVREPLELRELVRRTVDDHRAAFEAAAIDLRSELGPEPAWVEADATRLVQVLGNLLGNAAKFTPRGGSVTVSVRREGPRVAVLVQDDGTGIAPEVRDRLFRPFSQGPQPLDRTRGGLGLGLATVKGLVELHGGSVAIASDGLGRGTEVSFRLPVAAPPAEERPPAPPARSRRHRVLVIEDNDDAANTLGEVLRLCGHDVQLALDGPSGIARAQAFHPNVVLCDLGLPGMTGYEVARILRADRMLGRPLLVALSGYALPEDQWRALDAGFDRHLAKPTPLSRLEQVLAEAPAFRGDGDG